MTSSAVSNAERLSQPAYDAGLPSGIAALIAADFLLDQLVTGLAAHDGDLLTTLVMAALGSGNCAHLPMERFAAIDDVPPDHERRPLTVRQIADSLGQPYETVRRRFVMLEAAGLIARHGRYGFIVLAAGERTSERLEATRRTHGRIQRMVKTLQAIERR